MRPRALIVAVPATASNLIVGSRFGLATAGSRTPTRIPSVDIEVPRLLSVLATGTLDGEVQGLNRVQSSYERQYGSGDYIPPSSRPAGACG